LPLTLDGESSGQGLFLADIPRRADTRAGNNSYQIAGKGDTAPLKTADSVKGLMGIFDDATAETSGTFIRYDRVILPW
jgi:hypothetical protein